MLKAPNLIVESTYAGVPGVTRYRKTGDDGEPIEGPTVAVVGMVHGKTFFNLIALPLDI